MFAWLLDAAYVTFLLAASPWLIYRRIAQKKPIAGLWTKLTGNLRRQHLERPCLWFHAVSVGEVVQLQSLITRMQSVYPNCEFVITTTTATGFDVARSKYPDCTVQFFPLDFSWAVRRAMKQLRPRLIVLVELELWPNFLAMARKREIPVAIINGRISDQSFRTYQRFSWLVRPWLESCSAIAVQSPLNGERFLQLGAPPARVFQTGNIKYDGVQTQKDNQKTNELRQFFGILPGELVFLAGSTQAPEEEFALATWEKLRTDYPQLRLLLVPRHKERFEEVATMVVSRGHLTLRRSDAKCQSGTPASAGHSRAVLLLDTLGELSHAWGLADIAFVGGSLTNRGGQNMIEPAGYGAAVLFGPNTWNFRDVTEALTSRDAAVIVHHADELTSTVRRLLADETARFRLGEAGRSFVVSQQGATHRTVEILGRLLGTTYSVETRSVKAA